MAIKNQGIYLLVAEAKFDRVSGGKGLSITLADPTRHGIVNSCHTYAAIRDEIENADEFRLKSLPRVYVQPHVLHGLEDSEVAEIAEGLNCNFANYLA